MKNAPKSEKNPKNVKESFKLAKKIETPQNVQDTPNALRTTSCRVPKEPHEISNESQNQQLQVSNRVPQFQQSTIPGKIDNGLKGLEANRQHFRKNCKQSLKFNT